MKIKNRFFSIVFAVLLVLPMMCLLSGCGGDEPIPKEYAWGKTFSYQGVFVANKGQYGMGGTPYGELLKSEYNKNNIDLEKVTINGETKDLTSACKGMTADAFISHIDNLAKTMLEKKYENFVVKVGSEEEKTVTINNTTYNCVLQGGDYYNIKENDNNVGGFNSLISLDVDGKTKGCLNLSYNKFQDTYYNISMSFPTITICNDASADKNTNGDEVESTSISIQYYPYLSKVSE